MPSTAGLIKVGEDLFPHHPRYGYFVSCVNFPENGAWAPPPAPPDYSTCPITASLRDRMTETRSDFIDWQNPPLTREVTAIPRPGGGLVVDVLNKWLKVELVVINQSGKLLGNEVVAKGDLAASTAPITFQEKPSPTPPRSTATPSGASRRLAVPSYHQAYELSCEEASLRMALAFQGIKVTEDQIFSQMPVDPRAPSLRSDGSFTWGDPYAAFIGDRNGSEVAMSGYGTYYPTVAKAATALGGRVLRSGEGIGAADVYRDILAGHPVVAWVTYEWVVPARRDFMAFDGRRIPYAWPVEHAVTVVGVETGRVLINNPWSGQEWISKPVFEAAYATYNDMAVVLA